MATSSISTVSMSGGMRLKGRDSWSGNSSLFSNTTALTFQSKSNQQRAQRKMAICAQRNDRGGLGIVPFVTGFVLGGALGTVLGYVLHAELYEEEEEEVKRYPSYNEDDNHGFQRITRPIYMEYYDYEEDEEEVGGLEKTRQNLNAKIKQLNSAIDNVSSRLRRGNNNTPKEPEPVETEPKEATT